MTTPVPEPGSADERAAFVRGLINLASFLSVHTDVPLPGGRLSLPLPSDGDDDAALAEIQRIATLFGSEVTVNEAGTHRGTIRQFGPVSYEVSSVTAAEMDRYLTHMKHYHDGDSEQTPGRAA